ncbi:Uma2 family endonuclease [Hymenobacter sp. 5317J-9]|uniref:Uma2 family endonuclease n=1 Tax=Hymenobacter sp. 5317J-9 TaxID=2932250 RepID=UPI001FD70B04|nr:Uma2 family endonuclease [Hymenobacter sp. 5317J-9]UOQ98185.1 Uma2 family endonuclease [Hymenobacter sp. 5317J-9]
MGQRAFQTDLPAYVSPEDYLRLERAAEFKHEYFEGVVRAMAGASYAHNRICTNLTVEVGSQLRGKSCSAVGSDQRVQILSGNAYVYPDLTVVCGQPEFNEEKKFDTLLNPTLLVEVLSPSTANNDRGEKFMYYRQIPSLRQYLILDAQTVHAELYSRDELGRWVLTETRDLSAVLDLSSIACEVPLMDVYAGVELG